jgi:lipopolysaccharide transport system permease protein
MKKDLTLQENDWTMVIRPTRGLFDLRLGELWKTYDLIKLFVWRDFVTGYKQTALGPLWFFIKPVMSTLVFTVIFGQIASLPTDGLPDFLFYLSGTLLWTYFSSSVTKTSSTFRANTALFGKVYFHRLASPISYLVSNLLTFSIQFILFLALLLYFLFAGSDIQPNWLILLLPFLLLMMAGLGMGIGIVVSSVTTRYRDLEFLVDFGMQLFMYGTPIVYPLSFVPERYRVLALANPMTSIVETFRHAFLGTGNFDLLALLYSFGFTVVVLLIGIVTFNRTEATFMDTV